MFTKNNILWLLTSLAITGMGLFFGSIVIIVLGIGLIFLSSISLLIKKKGSYICYMLKCLFIAVILFEIILHFVILYEKNNGYYKDAIKEEHSDASITESDPFLGYKLKENLNGINSYLKVDDSVIYNTTYSSDKYSRRTCGYFSESNKHAIFIGGSYTFGEGLNCEDTFPFMYGSTKEDFTSYNYGMRGYGPHQISLLYTPGINSINTSSIKEKSGFMLYTYIDGHLERVYGGSRYLSFGSNTPDVSIQQGDIIIRKRGTIHKFIARLIFESSILRYTGLELRYPKDEKYYKRFGGIIDYTYYKYTQLFPGNDFYILMFPGYSDDLEWVKYISKQIKIITIPTPIDYNEKREEYVLDINYDLHPNKKMNQYILKNIYNYIK